MILDDFFNQSKVSVFTPEEEKYELFLGMNNFNEPDYVKGKKAIAQLIYNLLFLVPGTYPSAPHMGIDIRSYLFDVLSDVLLEDLRELIRSQMELYIPDSNITISQVEKSLDTYSGKENLTLSFSMMGPTGNDTPFTIYLGKTGENRVKSKIFF